MGQSPPRLAVMSIACILGFMMAAVFFYSIAVLAMKGTLCLDCAVGIPEIWAWSVFGLSLAVIVIAILQIVGTLKHIKGLLIFLVILTIITAVATIMFTVVLLLWTNNQNVGMLQDTVNGLENQFYSFIARWGSLPENAQAWQALQNNLKCCGVSLEASYDHPDWQTTLHTGAECLPSRDSLITLFQSTHPAPWNPDYMAAALANPSIAGLFQEPEYFCDAYVKVILASYTAPIGAALGVLSAIQLVLVALTLYLLCGVKQEDGGFAETDSEGNIAPLKGFISAPSEIVQDTKAFANRMSVSVGFGNVFNSPPPGMPPPGMAPPGMDFPGDSKPSFGGGGGGGAPQDFGPEFVKYKKMLKSGLPEGAVRQAMMRDGVTEPAGFFEATTQELGGGGSSAPAFLSAASTAMSKMGSRISHNVSAARSRASVNLRGMFAGGAGAPPAPPPGFGELPPEGSSYNPPSFGGGAPPGFGSATSNPGFGGGGAATFPEEFDSLPSLPAPSAPPPAAKPAPPKKAAKAAPPPKAPKAVAPKKAPPPKKAGGGGGGGGAPGFLADIAGGGSSAGFGLKKTVTNDRSAPNLGLL